MDVPEVRYARSGDVSIAYQVVGAAEVGDRGRRELMDKHHTLVRRELTRSRGIEVDTAGDGFLEDHGVHELKGVPGEWRLYAVRAA